MWHGEYKFSLDTERRLSTERVESFQTWEVSLEGSILRYFHLYVCFGEMSI